MSEIIEQIAHCIEFGKINTASPYPPDMRGQEGADELTKKALAQGEDAGKNIKRGHGSRYGKSG